MINYATATVKRVITQGSARDDSAKSRGLTEVEIDIDDRHGKAVNYDDLTGPVAVGDKVVVNTTAVDLSLGTGGYSFVLWNLSRGEFRQAGPGHLMKLRYTPLQRAALSVEEEESPHHQTLKDKTAIDGLPVIACELHSQLLPIAATIKEIRPDAKVAYVMTDGGALPAAFSATVAWLKDAGYLAATITAGQAFGGDFEAVNIYSALAAARYVVKADIAVTAMGPGIAGTGTALGHSGLEQGQVINAAAALGGRPIAVLRLSQADKRMRHLGISRHTVVALTVAALAPAVLPVPVLPASLAELSRSIDDRIEQSGLAGRHQVRRVENDITLAALEKIAAEDGPKASTMGRGPAEEPAFFLAAGAAGIVALDMCDQPI